MRLAKPQNVFVGTPWTMITPLKAAAIWLVPDKFLALAPSVVPESQPSSENIVADHTFFKMWPDHNQYGPIVGQLVPEFCHPIHGEVWIFLLWNAGIQSFSFSPASE